MKGSASHSRRSSSSKSIASDSAISLLQRIRFRQHIIEGHPELAGDATLVERLERAYAYAVVVGFTDFEAIARFLRYEATAPNFYRQPAIDAWLRAPGQPVEERFAEVLARVKSRLRRD